MTAPAVERLPAGPFREWCENTLVVHGTIQNAARACGVDWHTFHRYLHGAHAWAPDVDQVDRMLTAEGSTSLAELYPAGAA